MRIHYLQHVPFEELAGIEDWARAKGHAVTLTRAFQEEMPGEVGDIDLLVVLGGPMNVYEEAAYPWLVQEKRFLEKAIKERKAVLGICLGSQLLADVLGARVFQNSYKEIGWLPIELTAAARTNKYFADWPSCARVFHWHGDTFDLPAGAVRVASSAACVNQGFVYGDNVIALQFHIESTRENVARMLEYEADDITPGKYVQSPTEILARDDYFIESIKLMSSLLDRFVL